jgi:hypothetical protein
LRSVRCDQFLCARATPRIPMFCRRRIGWFAAQARQLLLIDRPKRNATKTAFVFLGTTNSAGRHGHQRRSNLVHNEFVNRLAVTLNALWFESRQCVRPVTQPTHSTDRRHPLIGDSQCGSHNRRNCHPLSLSQNWFGRCGPFSTRLSTRLMRLTGHPRQKRRWRNEFCGPHQMESLSQ